MSSGRLKCESVTVCDYAAVAELVIFPESFLCSFLYNYKRQIDFGEEKKASINKLDLASSVFSKQVQLRRCQNWFNPDDL